METLLVVLIVTLAAALLGRIAWRRFSGKSSSSCCATSCSSSSCGGCSSKLSCDESLSEEPESR